MFQLILMVPRLDKLQKKQNEIAPEMRKRIDQKISATLNQWNPGTCTYAMINYGNRILALDWEATDASTDASTCDGSTASFPNCWDLTTYPDQFQVDDDTSQSDDTGNLAVVTIQEIGGVPNEFNPLSGLEKCDGVNCDKKKQCYRYTVPDCLNKGYVTFDMLKEETGKCEYFVNNNLGR